jgi:hypothetical protein
VRGDWGEQETSAAAAEGDVLKLQQLHASGHHVSYRCWATAARGGHIAVLEELQRLGIVNIQTGIAGEAAARSGHLHLIQWLYEHHELELTSKIFELAAQGGGIEMLEWLRSHGCPWCNSAYGEAMWRGRLDILQWLRAGGCPLDEGSGGWASGGLVSIAAGRADTAPLRLLLEQGALPLQACNIEAAARHGRLKALELLHEYRCPMGEAACTAAAEGGYLAVLQWLRQRGCPWNEQVAERAVRRGDLKMLQWVVHSKATWSPSRCFSYAQTKHTAVAEWIRLNHLKKGGKKKQQQKKKSKSKSTQPSTL